MSIRVLHITPTLNIGGVANSLLSNVAELSRKNSTHRVCSITGSTPLLHKFLDAGIRTTTLDSYVSTSLLGRLNGLERLYSEFRPTVIHTHLPLAHAYGSVIARRHRVPIVSTLHGTNRNAFKRSISYLNNWLLAHETDVVIAVSSAVKEYWEAEVPSLKGQIQVVHNGLFALMCGVV